MRTVSPIACVLVSMALAAAGSAASATSLAGNLYSNDEGNMGEQGPVSTDPTDRIAASFVAGSSGTVSSLLIVAQASAADESFTLELYSDDGGNPGVLLASGSALAQVDGDRVTVAVDGAPQIESGTTYWVVLADSSSMGVRWIGVAETMASVRLSRDGSPWSEAVDVQPVLRITGTVGEPLPPETLPDPLDDGGVAPGPAAPSPDQLQSANSASDLVAAGGSDPRLIADDPTLSAPAPTLATPRSQPQAALGEASVDGAGGCQAGGAGGRSGGAGFLALGLGLALAFRRQRN